MATPVILQMNVHCNGCARKIRETARNVYGVEDVWASPETGVVVVTGNADAEDLRSRIEHKTGRAVTVVSGGAEDQAPDAWRMHAPPPDNLWNTHLAASSRRATPQEAPENWWTTHLASTRHAPPPVNWWNAHLASSPHATPQEAPEHWRMAHLAPSRFAPPPAYVHLAAPPPQYAPYPPPAYPNHGGWHGNQWSLV